MAEPGATKQLKFEGTDAFWKQLSEASTRSAFLLTQLQPSGLAQQQWVKEGAENLMLHSGTIPKWSYSPSVSLTSILRKIQAQIKNLEDITAINSRQPYFSRISHVKSL